MQNQDDLMHFLSRFTIIIPIIVVVVALILKFNTASYKQPDLEITSVPTINNIPKNNSNNNNSISTLSANLNLKGPLVCNFSAKEATVTAYIKDKKVSAQVNDNKKINNYLMRDDCVYMWNEGNFSGEKICGIGTYIGIIEGLMSSNLMDFQTLFKTLTQFNSGSSSSFLKNNFTDVLSSCRKEEITNLSVFDIPRQVLFKNKEIK